jgi:1,5-anhydro-D-fructose reductase (1,5-anhydro-D-mannitol-forming)
VTTVGWGLIGTRGYAASSAAPGITASRCGELLAVLGSDPERAATFGEEFGARVATTDPDEFLEAQGLEAVWITSPTWLHHEHTISALEAGHHVLCEKPLAARADDAWSMVRAARSAHLVLATGYQARYVPGHRAMASLVAEGAIGAVTVARTYYGVHRSGPPPEWRQKRATARWGALADIGTHHLDLLRMILGEVTDAAGLTEHRLGFETEDAGAACLRFESGAVATLTATVNVYAYGTRVELYGTKGLLVATNTSPAGKGDVVLYDSDGDGRDVTGARVESVWAEQTDAVSAVIRGEEVPYATGEDGARNVEILEALSE